MEAREATEVPFQTPRHDALILLDTNAVIFVLTNHRRARPLQRHFGRLRFSPFVLLEMRVLEEAGRGRAAKHPEEVASRDARWVVDEPPLNGVIAAALGLGWTRDPFDRLITAHAISRNLRLATADADILQHLPARMVLAL